MLVLIMAVIMNNVSIRQSGSFTRVQSRFAFAGWLLPGVLCIILSGNLSAQVPTQPQTGAQYPGAMVGRTATPLRAVPHQIQPINQQMQPVPEMAFSTTQRSIRDYSWIYIEEPQLEEIKQHDIITILVDKKYQDRVNSNFNRTRNASLTAELKEFLRISEDGNLTNAADNEPTVDAALQGKLTSTGALSNQEGVQYRIAAIVVEVLPNGNLVLEARDRIEINGDVFIYTLTGVLPSDKVAADMTASSDNVYNLDVSKKMNGKVGDSVKRPWGIWLYDKFSPF
ncbi:MAG: flagellar basal body L-ring protein FlgH [Planctomycetaceae bacterium]|nr:flagellar basal body L-ring protein FlgH [Planctomycetaceae bacterium]